MKKLKVGVLAATGTVGQVFISLLANHPQFELSVVSASERSTGKSYKEACHWRLQSDMPEAVRDLVLQPCVPNLACDVVFSALPSEQAGKTERLFAEAGYKVFTNASAHRMHSDVPLLIPEVNPEHMQVVRQQNTFERGGFIVANPNCSAAVIVPVLAPLHEAFGIKAVIVNTMQALSGAGYPGVASLDAIDNVVPYVPTEEGKMAAEARKMLGKLMDGHLHEASFKFSAHCNRVPVRDGHLETASVALERSVSIEEVSHVLEMWQPVPQQLGLYSAPTPAIRVHTELDRPQSRLDRNIGAGMTVSVGRLRPCEVLDIKFVALAHNLFRGAAGGSVLNAELALSKGYLS